MNFEQLASSGGSRQREEAARLYQRAGQQPQSGDSKFASALLMLFGWGLISAVTVQWLAAAAVADGATHPQLVKLAKLGKEGDYSGNCRRDLFRQWFSRSVVCNVTTLKLPMLNTAGDVVLNADQSFMPPNRLISFFWHKAKHMWNQVFGTRPRDFWARVPRDDPKFIALTELMSGSEGWEDYTYPLVLHGDGARFTNKNSDSLISLQWKSLLSSSFGVGNFPCVGRRQDREYERGHRQVVGRVCELFQRHLLW